MMTADPFVDVEKEIPTLVAWDALLQDSRDAMPVELTVDDGERLRSTGESLRFSLVGWQLPV